MDKEYDVVVIGSGPNGLSAGIALAEKGLQVLIVEGAETVGGGTRTSELTLPGFRHDVCSAVHPMGYLSPYLKTLPLEKFGLEWIVPNASAAHPLDGEEAVLLYKSMEETSLNLGVDGEQYKKILAPFVSRAEDLLSDSLKPLGIPQNPWLLARFGLKALQPATFYARHAFSDPRMKALFAGCTAHSVLPFDKFFTTAMGLMFLVTGHVENWVIPKGGSQQIANALAGYFESLGGEIQCSMRINEWKELPVAKRYVFDTDPVQLANIAREKLPPSYKNRLKNYQFGPGVFKIDYALDGPIPWSDPRCLDASTVHVGGTFAEVAASEKDAWEGRVSDKPFVMLSQQSQFDPTRAPEGKHTGWAYCHVPNGSTVDMTDAIENQIERFAPGFKDIILAKATMTTQDFYQYNPNYLGGAITGGAADIFQLFTRPVARIDPYSTPNPDLFICSASSPPGGGVHGMCGYHAAQSVLKSLKVT
ncbi:FAD-dependent oxidoreductase [Reichenbachiella sp. 5M10]|uniref:phytoene desaturase family protein n=1 Tax=Reichenbachiella sp. 5M10 TaxID=1889772 RepID=UPI000C1506B0|nr:NAD(P)/FAD-dependent oxidoreductase [Reichenbachiella sp. 5M10]PIB35304.1 FAD-dependent oxidoreductase [Reichenbachiella sp. 5M10]